MARNLSLALGRHAPSVGAPSTDRPSFRLRDAFAIVSETIGLIAAAGRVGAAVDARQAPSKADLKTAGLDKADIFLPPYRF